MESPKIDKRSPEDLMGEIRSLIPFYTPEWKPSEDDSGIALAETFTSMMGTVIHRLNRVPEKNFAAFLEMLGMKLLPPQPAIAPVTFSLSKGTKEHVFIRAGTQIAAEDILFETEKSMLATPSMLIKVYGVDAEDDEIYESPTNVVAGEPAPPFQTRLLHDSGEGDKEIFIDSSEGVNEGDLLAIRNKEYGIVSEVSDHLVKLHHKLEHGHASGTLIEKVTNFELFGGKDLQEHILYLGHTDLFNVKSAAEFTLTISPWDDRIADEGLVIWQYWGERLDGETKVLDWYDFDKIEGDKIEGDKIEGQLILTKNTTDEIKEIKERKINGIESRWIRCVANASRMSELQGVKIDTIGVKPLVKGALFPDMAFYNDVPLEIPEEGSPIIHPFGTRPRGLDTFYICSQEAFSKKGAEITIKFSISGADVVDNETPVIRVHGVGTEFESRLNDAKIYTIGQLTRHTEEELTEILKEGGTKPRSYYSTKAINVLEAAKKGFYDKSDSSGTGNDNRNISSSIGKQELILSWEYWDGKGWTVIDGLKGFKGDPPTSVYDFKFLEGGGVVFPYPEGIEAVKVSGQENYWIRVRIISGDYGKEMVYVNGAWVPGTINPPKISRITLSYELKTPVNPEHALTYNNLRFKDVSEESQRVKKLFTPFQPLDDGHKTLYLGFDKKLEKGPISIFFSFEEGESLEENTSKIEWCYYSQDEEWIRLEVSDNTQNLSRTGTVEFYIPADFARTSRFGDELYWIRAVDAADKFRTQHPTVKGIYINTTLATQAESIKNEILGSSDVSADQKFQFARIPVITEEIWVNEITTLSEEEKKIIIKEDGKDSIRESKDEAGKPTEVWVRWKPVEDFFDSKPDSCHYVVERATGEVTFGNGVHGMVPPVGRGNIKATYQVGGGRGGNVGTSEIATLKTSIPFVSGVTNPEAAKGGSDTERMEAVFERGSHQIKHRDRAVTEEDFERIARSASSYIARTKCYIEDGTLRIIVIPGGEEDKPIPSLTLRKTVEKHIKKRSLNLISPERVEVEKPLYTEVSITVVVVPDSMDVAVPLEKEILKRLKKFLHPLTGGPEESGWEFGRGVHISDVYALLEGIKDADHVEALELNDGPGDVAVEESKTVCSGEHKITMNPGSVR
jgi:hypothetical protein